MRRKRCFRAKGSRPWNNISALFWKEKRGWKFFYEFFSWNPGNEFPLSLFLFLQLENFKKEEEELEKFVGRLKCVNIKKLILVLIICNENLVNNNSTVRL